MKKICVFIIFILAISSTAIADDFTGTPAEFIVTINLVEFYNSTTDQWMVAGTGDFTFDITSVLPGQLCGGYGTPVGFTKGIYTIMRVTVSRTMQINDSQTHGAATYYTRTGTVPLVNGNIGGGVRVTQANAVGPAQRATMILSQGWVTPAADTDYFIVQVALAAPADLGPGTTKRCRIDFDAVGVLTYDHVNGACYINAQPNITAQFF
ncbi:hypothetical protein ACFL28_02670 [Candidatus Omnitrophota bacterium]